MASKKEIITHVLSRAEHNLLLSALAVMNEHDDGIVRHMQVHAKQDKTLRKGASRGIKLIRERQTKASKLQVKLIKTWMAGKGV